MLSIKKSTRRPFSWSIARKLTISASARAAAGAGGAALAGSACGFDGDGFWPGSSRPIRTRTDSAKVASVRYGRKGSVAGATAAPLTARISRTPRIKATLIADAYLCWSLVRLKMSLATITGAQIKNSGAGRLLSILLRAAVLLRRPVQRHLAGPGARRRGGNPAQE